jgi:hypothetical protein
MARQPAQDARRNDLSEDFIAFADEILEAAQRQVREAERFQRRVNEWLVESGYPYLDLEQAG